jgi:L-fuculose-phosphate aldolase
LSVPVAVQSVREQVAWACRILALEGYTDHTMGHVSARSPDGTIYIKRRGIALDEVAPDDVVDLSAPRAVLHVETVLHTEIYKLRPDVGAVVHGHPPYGTAFAATDGTLELLTHDSILFVDGISVFEEADLIVRESQGQAVAEALGTRRAALLRNHGVVIADKDLRWAVLSAVTLERAIRLQALAASLGPLRPVSQDRAERIHASKYQDHLLDELWAAWIRKARRAGADGGMPPE